MKSKDTTQYDQGILLSVTEKQHIKYFLYIAVQMESQSSLIVESSHT